MDEPRELDREESDPEPELDVSWCWYPGGERQHEGLDWPFLPPLGPLGFFVLEELESLELVEALGLPFFSSFLRRRTGLATVFHSPSC